MDAEVLIPFDKRIIFRCRKQSYLSRPDIVFCYTLVLTSVVSGLYNFDTFWSNLTLSTENNLVELFSMSQILIGG